MNFYVYQQDYEDPEAHLLDIFVGPAPPGSGTTDPRLKEFNSIEELHSFLKSVKIDQISTFRHMDCSKELIEELNQWIELNLPLHVISQSEDSGE